jgi:hypothetical protein
MAIALYMDHNVLIVTGMYLSRIICKFKSANTPLRMHFLRPP